MAFKTSVNIRFDVGKDEFINRYIPTPSHTEALKGLLDGFVRDSNRSHIIVGAYGTGKSLLATIISSIVSKSVSETEVEKLINKFTHFDDYIADQIHAANSLEKKYIPILLTGNEGRFRQAILSNIIKALNLRNIEVVLPGVTEKIIESVDKWKNEFPPTYNAFINLLEERRTDIDKWINEIKNQNENEINYFNDIYPTLTSGATFEVGFNEGFLTQMEYITELLNQNNLGLIIVHDEFGRFLQGLNSSSLNETMQDIQDLAELTDREKSLQFILLTHKSLRQYFSGMNAEIAREFQRIEKRFRQYNITSDQATFLKIAEVILTENIQDKPAITSDNYDNTITNLQKYTLFPSLNPTERERIIVKSMYPLHPVSLFILPQLSSVFGQNERTLFTFLESEETGGLINHIAKSDSYYMPFQLFDYFFSDASGGDVDTDVSKNLLLYKKAVARIPDNIVNKKLALNLIKFISIWNICGLQKEQKLSTEFLEFAMQMERSDLEPLINLLSNKKVIRFNRLGEYWEIHTGSAIDIQEKISQKKKEYAPTHEDVSKILLRNLSKRYYFPESYNDEKEMTRFAKVELLLDSDLTKIDRSRWTNSDTDLMIYYVIPEEKNAAEIKNEIMKVPSLEKEIFAIHPIPLSTVKEEIIESSVIESFMKDKDLLTEDKGIKEELSILLKEVNHVINKYLSLLSNFDENITWISNKSSNSIASAIDLSMFLSEKCYELYGETPTIINDSFNRMNCSSQQKVGAKKLIDNIINSPNEEQFGIEGNGPSYAIYASIFKNNHHFDKNVNDLDYRNIDYRPYRLLRDKLINLLDENPKGNFSDIINVFTGTPFGIRKPIIPILFVAMMRDRWNEFMLYRNGIYVPGLNGSKLYEILEEEGPENYQYEYEQIDEEFIQFFNLIENHFFEYIEERLDGKNNSRLIQICGTLVKWLRSLPRFTQISNSVNEEFISLRDLIRRTEVKPHQSVTELYELYNDDIVKLLRLKEYGENHLNEVKSDLEQIILKHCNCNDFSTLLKWSMDQHEFLKKNNELVKSLLNTKDHEDWLLTFLEIFSGVRVEDWSDKTYEKFIVDLEQSYDNVINFYKSEQNDNEENTKEKSEFITLEIGNKTKVISKVDFSVKAKTVYTNIDRILRNAGRNIPKNEMEYMIYLLLDQYVE